MRTNLQSRSNVILAVDPSHSTADEHLFWDRVSAYAKRQGWQLIQITRKLLPDTRDAITIQVPFHLAQCNRQLIPAQVLSWDWVDTEYLEILDEWEYLRWRLDERTPDLFGGLMRLAQFVDTVLSLVRPRVVITGNKYVPIRALFRLATTHYQIATALFDRSPLESIWLEREGFFAESSIWRDYEKCKRSLSSHVTEIGNTIVDQLVNNPYGFRRPSDQGSRRIRRGVRRLLPRLRQGREHRSQVTQRLPDTRMGSQSNGPIFFLPMDHVAVTGWTQRDHPQRVIDSPLYESPRQAIYDLAQKVQALGGSLIIKRHPSCRYLTEDMMPNHVQLYAGDLGKMLNLSDVVIVFNTKVAYPAIALGKPVVTLAPNPVACSGATYHCLNHSNVYETLELALKKHDLHKRLERFIPFVGWLASNVFYSCEESLLYASKGPARFVNDLVDMTLQPAKKMADEELSKAVREIRKMIDCEPSGLNTTKYLGGLWPILRRLRIRP